MCLLLGTVGLRGNHKLWLEETGRGGKAASWLTTKSGLIGMELQQLASGCSSQTKQGPRVVAKRPQASLKEP